MTSAGWTAVIVFWVIPIFVAHAQGKGKNRAGAAYGIFLGWIGVIILAVLPALRDSDRMECQYCREDVKFGAIVCPHCRRELAAPELDETT